MGPPAFRAWAARERRPPQLAASFGQYPSVSYSSATVHSPTTIQPRAGIIRHHED